MGHGIIEGYRNEVVGQMAIIYKDFKSGDIEKNAADNGCSFLNKVAESCDNEEGMYCNPITKAVKHDIVTINKGGFKCELYLAEYTPAVVPKMIGVANDLRMAVAIFAIELPFSVNPVFVESRTNATLNNMLGLSKAAFPRSSRVFLEGDFNRYFRVYTNKKNEMDAFIALAPNIMVEILEAMGDYDIEFAGNHIYLSREFPYVNLEQNGDIKIPYSLEQHRELWRIGEGVVAMLARASRPLAESGSTQIEPLWKMCLSVPQSYIQKAQIEITLFFLSILFMFSFPVLWFLFPVFLIWFGWRYIIWNQRKKQLILNWQRGKIVLSARIS